ncbi:uncharacterized protein I303_100527 [Kwoniella dejecticola CBS 10117]|uniref:Cytochrome c oxidase subunit 4 n=1 Tax=Kwoniella dejecticola CBS 10117 TaxID=1296121 RepID=A0A1A6AF76_9TREE|nr:cytochrome c oxidase subunit 4 [Kwoniella dejecticola CBS 10117]OBR88711.1 cytochrome c oxidase subunit 4 [Kwoniella dejecticola CBS 10117]
MSILRLRSTATPLARRFASTISVQSTSSNLSGGSLGNIEASWKGLSAENQYEIYQQLEQIQKKDWKELTLDEKKAAYFVAFGPHGPRTPVNEKGHGIKVFAGVLAAVGAAYGTFLFVRSQAPPPPATMSQEYQDQMTEYMKSQNMNPISGVSAEGSKKTMRQ